MGAQEICRGEVENQGTYIGREGGTFGVREIQSGSRDRQSPGTMTDEPSRERRTTNLGDNRQMWESHRSEGIQRLAGEESRGDGHERDQRRVPEGTHGREGGVAEEDGNWGKIKMGKGPAGRSVGANCGALDFGVCCEPTGSRRGCENSLFHVPMLVGGGP